MAAPQPPPTPTNFLADDGFPDDLVVSILVRVPCKDDRANMSLVCKAWRALIARLGGQAPSRPPLPRLLLPAPNPNGSARAVCVLSRCRVHQFHHYLTIVPHGARCFGSHDGAWLFLAIRDPHGHQLFNARTGGIRQLPVDMEMDLGLFPSSSSVLPITIHAAALSAAPDDASCVAVCIVTTNGPEGRRRVGCVARWRMGQQRAFEIRPPGGPLPNHNFLNAEDVVYHDGAFHLLLRHSGHISVCRPELLPDNRSTEEWQIRRFIHPVLRSNCDERVRARYLVSSRGELLLAVRFAPRANEPTSDFKVFRETRRQQMPDDDFQFHFPVTAYPWAWSKLDTLDGRILFVGHGCSRSYEVDEYEGFKFKAGIYFLDDGMFFVEVQGTLYPCSDNGRWSDGRVEHCFPPADPSCNSPPAWLLP